MKSPCESCRGRLLQQRRLKLAHQASQELQSIFLDGATPSFQEVLDVVAKSGLFTVPDALMAFVSSEAPLADLEVGNVEDESESKTSDFQAWRNMLATDFWQIDPYSQYMSGQSPFGTHQGVKGLEFPRVMVLISDDEARGFLFSYDKLFGVKQPSESDLKRQAEGEETGIDRTRRLFYVTCSRAEEGLAIVCYTEDPAALISSVVDRGWFDATEASQLY